MADKVLIRESELGFPRALLGYDGDGNPYLIVGDYGEDPLYVGFLCNGEGTETKAMPEGFDPDLIYNVAGTNSCIVFCKVPIDSDVPESFAPEELEAVESCAMLPCGEVATPVSCVDEYIPEGTFMTAIVEGVLPCIPFTVCVGNTLFKVYFNTFPVIDGGFSLEYHVGTTHEEVEYGDYGLVYQYPGIDCGMDAPVAKFGRFRWTVTYFNVFDIRLKGILEYGSPATGVALEDLTYAGGFDLFEFRMGCVDGVVVPLFDGENLVGSPDCGVDYGALAHLGILTSVEGG